MHTYVLSRDSRAEAERMLFFAAGIGQRRKGHVRGECFEIYK